MNFEEILASVTGVIWDLFLPILVIAGLYIWIKIIFGIRKKISTPSKATLKQAIGPISISLGAMVGTGAIVGVLGAINKLPANVSPEAISVWSLVGMVLMIPLIYSEVLVTKVMNKSPKEYISYFICKKAGVVYAFAFMILYVFGFGGFQFGGINDVAGVIITDVFHKDALTSFESYIYIVMALFVFSAGVILTKKHELFINMLTVMISIAVVAYIIFLGAFIIHTNGFAHIYLNTMWQELIHPVNMAIGLPVGLLFGLQRIIQTAEAGLGGLAMSSLESDSKPRAAAIIAMIPSTITIIIAIMGTTYVASYGIYSDVMEQGNVNLESFFLVAQHVTGTPGVIIIILFAILSGLTTLIGSYYFVDILMPYKQNSKIGIYIILIFVAGTLAVFGASIVFEMIDLLMFLVTALNMTALFIFARRGYKKYLLDKK